jgi:hypothetical protein
LSSELPKHLPRTLALFVALPFLSWGGAAMVADEMFGRPSSTSSVGIITIPILSVVLGAGAYVLGLLLRPAWRALGGATWASPRTDSVLLIALASTCVLAGVIGVTAVWRHEAEAAPHMLRDTGVVRRLPQPVASWEHVPAPFVASGFRPSGRQEFPAGTIVVAEGRVSFAPASREMSEATSGATSGTGSEAPDVPLDHEALDYVTAVYTAPLAPQVAGDDDLVAVLVVGRATGHRNLLAVLDRSGALVYEELLERPRNSLGARDIGLELLHEPRGRAADFVSVEGTSVLVRAAAVTPAGAPR